MGNLAGQWQVLVGPYLPEISSRQGIFMMASFLL